MEAELLRFPHKKIRAAVIKEYMIAQGYKKAVCFSCGNASRELKEAGVDVLDISVCGDLVARRWFTPSEVKKWFPDCFDATSGHLSIELMNKIAEAYKDYLKDLPPVNYIPTGSGETIVCLKTAFSDKKFVAVYNINEATEYSDRAVLNGLVKAVAAEVVFADKYNNWHL